jgi:hypothetical protein
MPKAPLGKAGQGRTSRLRAEAAKALPLRRRVVAAASRLLTVVLAGQAGALLVVAHESSPFGWLRARTWHRRMICDPPDAYLLKNGKPAVHQRNDAGRHSLRKCVIAVLAARHRPATQAIF